ncbi:hypothetical protein [Moraxella lacunata]
MRAAGSRSSTALKSSSMAQARLLSLEFFSLEKILMADNAF